MREHEQGSIFVERKIVREEDKFKSKTYRKNTEETNTIYFN